MRAGDCLFSVCLCACAPVLCATGGAPAALLRNVLTAAPPRRVCDRSGARRSGGSRGSAFASRCVPFESHSSSRALLIPHLLCLPRLQYETDERDETKRDETTLVFLLVDCSLALVLVLVDSFVLLCCVPFHYKTENSSLPFRSRNNAALLCPVRVAEFCFAFPLPPRLSLN